MFKYICFIVFKLILYNIYSRIQYRQTSIKSFVLNRYNKVGLWCIYIENLIYVEKKTFPVSLKQYSSKTSPLDAFKL